MTFLQELDNLQRFSFFFFIMCGSNRWCTTPLSGKGGDITLFRQNIDDSPWGRAELRCDTPAPRADLVREVPGVGISGVVMSPPFPDRGVVHHRFEPHIMKKNEKRCKLSNSCKNVKTFLTLILGINSFMIANLMLLNIKQSFDEKSPVFCGICLAPTYVARRQAMTRSTWLLARKIKFITGSEIRANAVFHLKTS